MIGVFRVAGLLGVLVAGPAMAAHSEHEAPVGLVLSGLLLVIYLTPTFVALRRASSRTGRILLVNLLLGWTLIGWVAALVWALEDVGADEHSA